MADFTPDCGACNVCCKLLQIPLLSKPAGMLCVHTGPHGGCDRQCEKQTAPELAACDDFECVWLASQKSPGRLPRHLRPNLCHVLLTIDYVQEKQLYAQVDPEHPQAWKDAAVMEYLQGCIERGWKVEIDIGENHFAFEIA